MLETSSSRSQAPLRLAAMPALRKVAVLTLLSILVIPDSEIVAKSFKLNMIVKNVSRAVVAPSS